MPKTCLIGGAGFIGTAVTRELLKRGRNVVVIDRNPPQIDEAEYRAGDFGEEDFMTDALQDVDEVMLLAYASVPKTSFDDPFMDIQSNLPPTLRLFRAAMAAKVKKVVVVSSGGTVYGAADQLPIPEHHPTNPISPYGITKLTIEKYARMFHELYGMPYTVVRPGNAYGPGQQPFSGQGLVATMIASMLRRREFTLFGENITRDYVYIDDLARAMAAVIEKGHNATIYNIGTGVGVRNEEILKLVEAEARRRKLTPTVKRASARPFDVLDNGLDASRLTKHTGWQPTMALKPGLQQTWDWLESLERVRAVR